MIQLNRETKQSMVPVKKDPQQSGFVILMGLLLLVLGAAAWYGSTGNIKTEKMKTSFQANYVKELERIKIRMLTYAILNPEIFDAGNITSANPGVGYFPCPDTTGNGQTNTGNQCAQGNNLYAMGWVPQRIIDRSFSFLSSGQELENKRYWFAVDTRFLVDGGVYNFGGLSNRFAPLNIRTPLLVDPTNASLCDEDQQVPPQAIPANCVPPLTLDGQGGVVMLLFYAGEDFAESSTRELNQTAQGAINRYLEQPSMVVPSSSPGHNATGTFISNQNLGTPFNDYVITITRNEWNAAVLSRVARDLFTNTTIPGGGVIAGSVPDSIPDLCAVVNPNTTNTFNDSWFNECRIRGGGTPYLCDDPLASTPPDFVAVDNIEGQNWRAVLGCP